MEWHWGNVGSMLDRLSMIVIAVAALWGAAHQLGPFVRQNDDVVLSVQLYLIVIAPPALLHLVFGLRGFAGDAALSTRRGDACQRGAARALAAWLKRRAARPHSRAAGQADAMAILTRRTETRTSAPIFRSLRRMLPQVALAKMVSARPMRRRAQSST